MAKISIIGQISEVERELAVRESVYARHVSAGKMKQGEADMLIDRMRAVRETLLFVQKHKEDFHEFYAAKHGGQP